jgi:prepilin-type N-terminal cleavage/methylation domain-containing protein
MKKNMRRRSRFTLIELLAVIAILSGIILPVSARAKEKAVRLTCMDL